MVYGIFSAILQSTASQLTASFTGSCDQYVILCENTQWRATGILLILVPIQRPNLCAHENYGIWIFSPLPSLTDPLSQQALRQYLVRQLPLVWHSLTEWKFHIPLDTKWVILEMVFPVDLLASVADTKWNTISSTNTKRVYTKAAHTCKIKQNKCSKNFSKILQSFVAFILFYFTCASGIRGNSCKNCMYAVYTYMYCITVHNNEYAYHSAQLSYTTQHRTVLIISHLNLQTNIIVRCCLLKGGVGRGLGSATNHLQC